MAIKTTVTDINGVEKELSKTDLAIEVAKLVCEICDSINDADTIIKDLLGYGGSYFKEKKGNQHNTEIKLRDGLSSVYFADNRWGGNDYWNKLIELLKNNNYDFRNIRKEISKRKLRADQKPKRNNLQLILYGAPGTGKSFEINKDLEGQIVYRTTFHPDTDYATFVGCYKPDMDKDNIIYSFIPQIFIKAYLKAWEEYITWEKVTNHPQSLLDEDKTEEDKEIQKWKDVYLVIEEINRGGCAQIFGDIFQLLDRDDEGWSQYVIIPDQDIAKYLDKSAFPNNPKLFDNYKKCIKKHYEERDKNKKSVFKVIIDDNETYLALPPNFHIWATMNTSDQSLFPMDSAFKRRWDWEYVPINPDHEKVKGLKILLNNHEYEYPDFLNKVNSYIKSLHNSADKQIGEFFVKSKDDVHISFKDFRDKILFYLFNDVFKDNKKFREEFNDGNFLFEDLYIKDEIRQKDIVSEWLDKLGVNHISTKQNQDETTQDSETDDTDNQNEL